MIADCAGLRAVLTGTCRPVESVSIGCPSTLVRELTLLEMTGRLPDFVKYRLWNTHAVREARLVQRPDGRDGFREESRTIFETARYHTIQAIRPIPSANACQCSVFATCMAMSANGADWHALDL